MENTQTDPISAAYQGQHVWKCERCSQQIRRTANRDPNRPSSSSDFEYYHHHQSCGGSFIKIAEPPKVVKSTPKKSGTQKTMDKYLKASPPDEKLNEEVECPLCKMKFDRENSVTLGIHVNVCLDSLYTVPSQQSSQNSTPKQRKSSSLPLKRKLELTKHHIKEESKIPRLSLLFDKEEDLQPEPHLFKREKGTIEPTPQSIEETEDDEIFYKPLTYNEFSSISVPKALELHKENQKKLKQEAELEAKQLLEEEERLKLMEEEAEKIRKQKEEEKAQENASQPSAPVRRSLFPDTNAEQKQDQKPAGQADKKPAVRLPPKIPQTKPQVHVPPKVATKPSIPVPTPPVVNNNPPQQKVTTSPPTSTTAAPKKSAVRLPPKINVSKT
jgi:hypothetical protein